MRQLKDDDRLIQTAFDTNTLGLLDVPARVLAQLELYRTVPNPARGQLSVLFSLPGSGAASLELLDLAGRRMAGRELGVLAAGRQVVSLTREAESLQAGMYFVRLSHAGKSVVGRVVLLP